jgi:hypothetical protein
MNSKAKHQVKSLKAKQKYRISKYKPHYFFVNLCFKSEIKIAIHQKNYIESIPYE